MVAPRPLTSRNAPDRAAAVLGDAFGVGQRQQHANAQFSSPLWGGSRRNLRPALRHGAGVAAARRAVAAQRIEALAQIDIVAAEAALADEGGNFRSRQGVTFRAGIDHHARQPRRQRQAPQQLALGGDAAVAVDGAELDSAALWPR